MNTDIGPQGLHLLWGYSNTFWLMPLILFTNQVFIISQSWRLRVFALFSNLKIDFNFPSKLYIFVWKYFEK